jgi:uncharacterized protein (TIGR00661 family)
MLHAKTFKIFYAVQATGNGHISRALEIYPYLQKYGTVDVFLSGSNYDLKCDLPIAYKSKGISLAYNQQNGSIDIKKTITNIRFKQVWREAKHLPIEKYDLIINDFESITSMACQLKGKHSIHFGHQASFLSKQVPRPIKKDMLGEFVLSNYARASSNIGLHFEKYDRFIFQPIIKRSIVSTEPRDEGHFTVYLSQFSLDILRKYFHQLNKYSFQIFSGEVTKIHQDGNIKFFPVNKELFNTSLISCHGMITSAGFETPAEVLYLGKKLMVIPISGQYEQVCNAVALDKSFGVKSVKTVDENFSTHFYEWIKDGPTKKLELKESTEEIIEKVMGIGLSSKSIHQLSI